MDVHARAPASRQSGSAGCDGKWLRPGGLGRLQNQSTPQIASDLVLPFSSPLKVEMSFLNKSARGARSRKNGIRSGEFRRMFSTHFSGLHPFDSARSTLSQAGRERCSGKIISLRTRCASHDLACFNLPISIRNSH